MDSGPHAATQGSDADAHLLDTLAGVGAFLVRVLRILVLLVAATDTITAVLLVVGDDTLRIPTLQPNLDLLPPFGWALILGAAGLLALTGTALAALGWTRAGRALSATGMFAGAAWWSVWYGAVVLSDGPLYAAGTWLALLSTHSLAGVVSWLLRNERTAVVHRR